MILRIYLINSKNCAQTYNNVTKSKKTKQKMNTTQEVPQYVSSDEDVPEEATTSKKKQ